MGSATYDVVGEATLLRYQDMMKCFCGRLSSSPEAMLPTGHPIFRPSYLQSILPTYHPRSRPPYIQVIPPPGHLTCMPPYPHAILTLWEERRSNLGAHCSSILYAIRPSGHPTFRPPYIQATLHPGHLTYRPSYLQAILHLGHPTTYMPLYPHAILTLWEERPATWEPTSSILDAIRPSGHPTFRPPYIQII